MHSRGLKFGIYGDYGTFTCAGYPGIVDNLEIDAATFAEWQVDYVKLDGCYSPPSEMDKGYPEFGYLLNQTGRPIVYSCSWPFYQLYAGRMVCYAIFISSKLVANQSVVLNISCNIQEFFYVVQPMRILHNVDIHDHLKLNHLILN